MTSLETLRGGPAKEASDDASTEAQQAELAAWMAEALRWDGSPVRRLAVTTDG